MQKVEFTDGEAINSDMKSINFTGANLENADFLVSNLSNVNFTDASIKNIRFLLSNLSNVNFNKIDLSLVIFKDILFCGKRLAGKISTSSFLDRIINQEKRDNTSILKFLYSD